MDSSKILVYFHILNQGTKEQINNFGIINDFTTVKEQTPS